MCESCGDFADQDGCCESRQPRLPAKPSPEVGEDGLVNPPTLTELFAIYTMEETLAYKAGWKMGVAKQHQVDLARKQGPTLEEVLELLERFAYREITYSVVKQQLTALFAKYPKPERCNQLRSRK